MSRIERIARWAIGPRITPWHHALAVLAALAVALSLAFLAGCGGKPPIDEGYLRCLATCKDGTCQKNEEGTWVCVPNPTCEETGCPEGQVCEDGKCRPETCEDVGCPDGQQCIPGGMCVADNCPFNGHPEGEPNYPWCGDIDQKCSTEEVPCKTNPSQDPYYCEKAKDCPPPPPPPPPPPKGLCGQEMTLVADSEPPPLFHGAVKKATDTLGDQTNISEDKALAKVAEQVTWTEKVCTIAGGEAIFIFRPDTKWEENHAVKADDAPNHNGGWTNNGRGKYIGVHRMPDAPSCGLPDPRPWQEHAIFKCGPHNGLVDCTYTLTQVWEFCNAFGYGYYGEIGGLKRASCPVGPEGSDIRLCWELHPEVIGQQQWWCDGQPINFPPGANRAQARCRGHWKTCTENGKTCAEGDW